MYTFGGPDQYIQTIRALFLNAIYLWFSPTGRKPQIRPKIEIVTNAWDLDNQGTKLTSDFCVLLVF